MYQVSPPCIAWCASLRSEEVVTGKSVRGNFLSVVFMETLKYTCKQNSSRLTRKKIRKMRQKDRIAVGLAEVGLANTNIRELMLDGGDMHTEFHLHTLYGVQV